MKKMDQFFFTIDEDEEVSAHDAGWFYGILSGAIALAAFVLVVTL